jgi:hypothetical protein
MIEVHHLVEHITEYMMAGVLVVVGVSQVNRILGSVLGISFWLAVAAVGQYAYNSGAKLGFPGLPFSREVFFALCAGFVFINVVGLRHRLRVRRDARERSSTSDT